MFCKHCGKELPDDSNFCSNCGEVFDNIQENSEYKKRREKESKRRGWALFFCTLGGILLAIAISVVLFTSICIFELADEIKETNNISYNETVDKYGVAPQGSAQFLDGNSILVSVYVTSDNFWTSEENCKTKENMKLAVDYIKNCGLRYGKNINLIYDDGVNDDLQYCMTYKNALEDSKNDNYEFDKVFNSWINESVPVEKLKEKYNTDSIGYVIFLDSDGVSYTIAHFLQDGKKYFNEYSVIYLYEDKKNYEVPSVYAHEILHMFGAIDLYKENKSDGITREFVNYVDQNYPNEIMYTTYESDYKSNYKEITQQMSDITAYMVGLTDSFKELNQYPELEKDCRACFSRY